MTKFRIELLIDQGIAVCTLFLVLSASLVSARAQQPPTPSTSKPAPSTSATPARADASPQATPSPQSTPFSGPSPAVAVPPPSATPPPPPTLPISPDSSSPSLSLTTQTSAATLTLDEALRLSNALSSGFQQAGLNEQLAAEDLKRARAAFLPQVNAPLSYLYTSPALGLPPGTPRVPSFLANNAIGEYQAYLNVSGDIDIAGRLRATLAKNRALLEAAHAGTEVARRALALAVIDAYYGWR